jgi:phosphoribosyl-AMP cyclohydrolase
MHIKSEPSSGAYLFLADVGQRQIISDIVNQLVENMKNKAGMGVLMPKFNNDPDGLLPVVVQDKRSGTVLMLAYANEQCFLETVETGEAVYYSRSRRRRWKKGETSGNFQHVVGINLDCDGDAILYTVIQTGTGACHSGKWTCFWRSIIGYVLEASVGKLKMKILPVHENIANGIASSVKR